MRRIEFFLKCAVCLALGVALIMIPSRTGLAQSLATHALVATMPLYPPTNADGQIQPQNAGAPSVTTNAPSPVVHQSDEETFRQRWWLGAAMLILLIAAGLRFYPRRKKD